SDTLDPSFYRYTLGKNNAQASHWNWVNYTPAAVDELLNAGTAVSNPAKRFAIYSKVLQRLALDVPYLPIANVDASYAISNKFTWSAYRNWYYHYPWALDIKAR